MLKVPAGSFERWPCVQYSSVVSKGLSSWANSRRVCASEAFTEFVLLVSDHDRLVGVIVRILSTECFQIKELYEGVQGSRRYNDERKACGATGG